MGEKRHWGATSVKRVLISVEGQTEETFVREVLSPYLSDGGIVLIPTLVNTKIVKSGPNFKGGVVSYGKVKRDLQRLLNDADAVAVTTMYDVYELPKDFPGYGRCPGRPYDKVACLEAAFAVDINHRRFKPYLQLHEFEAFLFVDPAQTGQELGLLSRQVESLTQIRAGFATPEEINDHPQTASSKRLLNIYHAYDKTFDGPLITVSVGLARLRAACPHFDGWVKWLENL